MKILADYEKKKIVEMIIESMNRDYVYPEVAEKAVDKLKDNIASNRYENIVSYDKFAVKLTNDIQKVTKDRHLNVYYDHKLFNNVIKRESDSEQDKQIAKASRIEQERLRNFGVEKVVRLKGNIGYIDLRFFPEPEHSADYVCSALNLLSNSDSIIFDLRNNGGGSPSMVQLICSYFFKSNDNIHLNTIYYRTTDKTFEYWTLPHLPGNRLIKQKLYILTSPHTFSGAEEFAYNMKHLKRGTIIGETTGGGANPGSLVSIYNGIVMKMASGFPTNPVTKTNWEQVGVKPDINVDYDYALDFAHIKALKELRNDNNADIFNKFIEEIESSTKSLNFNISRINYSGNYEDIQIRQKDGSIFFKQMIREFKLVPLSKYLFYLEDSEFSRIDRIKFDFDDNNNPFKILLLKGNTIIGEYEKSHTSVII